MWRQKNELKVPMIERRRRKRIMTLKNFGTALILLIAVFVVVNIRSELRGKSADDYGRIVTGELPQAPDVAVKPAEVVTEGTIADQQSADPFSVNGAAREQFLGVNQSPVPLLEPQPQTVQSSTMQPRGGDLAIVGDESGVSIVQTNRERPQLSGGFGRPRM